MTIAIFLPKPWDEKWHMKPLLVPMLTLLLASCQVYAGGGTLVSDGRTTTVRTSEVEAGTETGPRARLRQTIVREEPPLF
jgi:hypothetical protein